MREAITGNGHGLIEVGLYQKEDRLVIHGVFEVKTSEMADERSKILRDFLVKSKQIDTEIKQAEPRAVPEANLAQEKAVIIPLQNAERDD
jgi:hypothetical protein